MLKLITGRIGSGKTKYIHNLIKEQTACGESAVLIVPEQYSFYTEKTMLELLGAKDADRVEVVSFSFLAQNLLKKYGLNSKAMLDDSTRTLMMSLALESVSDKLTVYGRHRYSISVIREMLKIQKEFRQCAVTVDMLRSTAERMSNSLLRAKLREIALVCEAYTAMVDASYFDDECALDVLCEVLDNYRDFENKTVYIDGFRGFTPQEYKVLERIFQQSAETNVTLCVDSGTNIDGDFSAFAHTRRTKQKLIATANRRGVSVAKSVYIEMQDDRYANAELSVLEKALYQSDFEKYENETENIAVCCAEDFESECEYVAHTVKRLIRTENIRCRDIAVISRSENNYSSSIRRALKKAGIPVFEDRRQPVSSQPLMEFVCSAVDIAANGFTVDSVMRVLKTGLTKLSVQEISELENYALMWRINGGKWLEEWTAHPDGLGEKMREKDIERLEKINEYRIKAVAPLQKFRVKLKDFTGLDGAKAVYSLLTEMKVDKNLKNLAIRLNDAGESVLADEQSRIWDLLMEILDRIAVSLENTHLTASRFSDLLNLVVSTYSVGSIPQGLDEIVIGSADRVKTTAPKVVFAVGMNDGVFPMIPVSGGILSENERKALADMDLQTDDSFEEKMMEEHFIAYNTLCSSAQKLYVTYLNRDFKGNSMSRSEIITQICNAFPKLKIISTADTPLIDYVEGEALSFELMARLTRRGGEMHSALERYFSEKEEYKGKIQAIRKIEKREDFTISDTETAKKLFGLNMYMSASRTEVYHKCPFEYFCKYGLNAQPRKTAELDPMKKGTATHYILESLISAYGSDGLCAMEKSQRDECINTLLEEYFSETLSAGEDMGDRFYSLFRQLGFIICEVVDRLVAEFSVSEFKPVAFELKIDDDGEVKTYDIPLPDGGVLRIKGSVDRVDAAELGDETFIRVVDYKSNGKKFNLNEVLCGLNMQMLIYLFAIWKNGFRDYKKISPAGILYMPVNAPFANTERDAEPKKIENEKIKKAKMNGMVLDDSRVVYAMDGGSGTFIPAKIKKDGMCSGTVISLKQMDLLLKRVEKILSEMAVNLHNGIIPAMPAKSENTSGEYKDVCKNCDYRGVCRKDENTPVKQIFNLSHDDSIRALGGEENA